MQTLSSCHWKTVRNSRLPDCGLKNKRETAAKREFEVAPVNTSWLHSSYSARALPLAIFSRKELVLKPRVSDGNRMVGSKMTMECGRIVGARRFNEEGATPDPAARDRLRISSQLHAFLTFFNLHPRSYRLCPSSESFVNCDTNLCWPLAETSEYATGNV
jgi:hypothetical protein